MLEDRGPVPGRRRHRKRVLYRGFCRVLQLARLTTALVLRLAKGGLIHEYRMAA